MKILIDNKLEEFHNNLYSKEGKISFSSGQKIKVNPKVKYIVPGFIDRHTHGGYGVDFMDGDVEGNKRLLKSLASEGITTVIPTTMTMDYPSIIKSISAIKKAKDTKIKIAKIHLEGPFLNIEKIGAQNSKYLKNIDLKFIDAIKDDIILISYAPELDLDCAFIDFLNNNKIIGSIVHSNATVEEIIPAYQKGLKSFSHFQNGSSGYNHRTPGVVNAGLGLEDVFLELICDGYHVDPFVIKTIYKLKGNKQIVLITDSMRAKGLDDGIYQLGGQETILKENQVRLKSGSLAGSVLKMNHAVENYYNFTDCKIEEAFMAASWNVAKSLNLKNIGKIKENYACDLTMLNDKFEVIQTFVNGLEVYKNKQIK